MSVLLIYRCRSDMAVRLLCGTAGGPSALAGAVAEERLDELFAVEYAQLVDAFSDADVTDRDVELVADADYHAAFGCAVEFGDGERSDLRRLRELPGLLESVLSGRAVQHEHHLVRRAGNYLAHDVADFGQLVHQVDLVVQTARRVDQHHVGAAGNTGVQGDPAHLMTHDFHNKRAPVRGGRGMDAVDGVGGDIHRALETERHIGAPKVVIDRFGQANHVEAFLAEQVGGFLRSVAAQHNQTVEAEFLIIFFHGLYFIQAVFIGFAHLLERLTGRAQNGAAFGENARKIVSAKRQKANRD